MGSIWIKDAWQEELEKEKSDSESWTEFLKRKFREERSHIDEAEVERIVERKIEEIKYGN